MSAEGAHTAVKGEEMSPDTIDRADRKEALAT
jgi:hypothetical protein